jgi:hypothetical protein
VNSVPYVYNNVFPFHFRLLLSDQHCSRPLQLRFLNSCKVDKYSKQKVEADDKTPLKVAIYDHKNEIITSEPFSSMRVHIVPIEGDFDNDHKGQWSEEYFRSKIVSGRPGKEPLLFGDLYIRLQDGVGYLNTAKFQDNSSFVKSKRFKLGVMATDKSIAQKVQEGITESFAVKDIRAYCKLLFLFHHQIHVDYNSGRVSPFSHEKLIGLNRPLCKFFNGKAERNLVPLTLPFVGAFSTL